MKETLETKLARIEETVTYVKRDIDTIKNSIPKIYIDVEIIKRDRKWLFSLVVFLSGLVGTGASLLSDFFRR